MVPPIENKIAGTRDVFMSNPELLSVVVAKHFAHSPTPDERRIAEDIIGMRPFRPTGGYVVIDGGARGVVGYVFTSSWVSFVRNAVPAGNGLAVIVTCKFFFVVGENGVTVLDVVELFEDGFLGHGVAVGAEVPLEVADPEDEVGDGGGAGVDFNAAELVGVNCEADVFEWEKLARKL